jgi:hypothetical protein
MTLNIIFSAPLYIFLHKYTHLYIGLHRVKASLLKKILIKPYLIVGLKV